MYLDKVNKIGNMKLTEILTTAEYIEYLGRPAEYADTSFTDWCGREMDNVRLDMLDEVKKNIKKRYSVWDTEQKYGYESVEQNVAYWRKANQIHNWFVENVQDGIDNCGYYIVSKEQLTELYDTAKKVLDSIKLVPAMIKTGEKYDGDKWVAIMVEGKTIDNPTIAERFLPTQSGFFFGNTEYDEYYYDDIKETVEQLEKIFEETDFDNEIVYYSSSW